MEPEKKSNGALIGSIIIIIILIIGGIYLWQKKITKEDKQLEETLELEADLSSIDLDSIDSEL